MSTPGRSRAYTFSLLTAAVLAIQATTGVFVAGLYRDGVWVSSVLRGQDVVALTVVLPILLVSHVMARRGSIAWRLVWIGTLYKIFYNNLYYLTGADFNRAFLLYPALAVCSAFAVGAALIETDTRRLDPTNLSPTRRRVAAAILLGCAGILTVLWVGQSLAYVFNGRLPQIVVDGGGGTHLVAAFDLTCIVPLMALGGHWLLQRRPWGYLVAAIMFVQGTLIVIDLVITPAFQAAAGVTDAWMMVPVWVLMGAGFLTGATALIPPGAVPAPAESRTPGVPD